MSDTDDYIKDLEKLVKQQEADNAAIRSEFAKDIEEEGEVTPASLRKSLNKLVPEAFATMQQLMSMGENDNLRFGVAKFVLNAKLTEKDDDSANTITALLNEFTKKAETPTT